MKKKILIMGIIASLFLTSVSVSTAVITKDTKEDKEESPLFRVRVKKAISQKIQKIRTKFFGNRLFFLPFQFRSVDTQSIRQRLQEKTDDDYATCYETCRFIQTCDITECRLSCDGQGFTCDITSCCHDHNCETCGLKCITYECQLLN